MAKHTETKPSNGSEIGGYDLAVAVTGIGKSTLYSMVATKQIPHIKIGKRHIRFERRTLEHWLRQHSVLPDDLR